jgi:hypothetical protein
MALDVEGVVDGGVCGKKFLGRPRALEPLHLALPPTRRLMQILSSIVLPSPALMPAFDSSSRAAAPYDCKSSVTNRLGAKAYFFRSLRISFSVVLVSLGLDQHIKDLAFCINRSPKVDHSAIDFHIDLVEMPSRVRFRAALS